MARLAGTFAQSQWQRATHQMQSVWKSVHQYVPFASASGERPRERQTITMSTLPENEDQSIPIEETHRFAQFQSA